MELRENEMIRVDHVGMRFNMTEDRVFSLKEYMMQAAKGKIKKNDFWALKDISFSVNRGDVLGVIGRNGAGKSTLLKIISGIMKPTQGETAHKGVIVPMLELGSGFDMELTGRENIFLNGAILGYSREFLEERYNNILCFSELQSFIDMPIRNYSSGMMMRLAFSVATAVDSDILIVDEILAVGDEAFQRKSRDRMMEQMSNGTTVLFVSHNMSQIREMCNKVIWIEDGYVKAAGETQEVCDMYNIG